MADIRAFRATRYDLSRVGALADVIAPPYDVIDTPLSDQLHAKSPYNVIRLILDPILPSDNETNNRYSRSASLLKRWKSDGILTEERDPAIYVYYQTFDWEGRSFTRRGFMARTRLEPFGEGKIFPHEETLSGPKADRLKLFHSTGMNLSQIFGLYPDEENEVARVLDQVVQGKPPIEATDHLNVLHRMWTVTDPEVVARLQSLMGPRPLFIADGHHRYETGLKHREERAAAGLLKGPDDPANFTLMMMVGMSDPGLRVMPTHRLVKGLGNPSAERLRVQLSGHFDVDEVGKGPKAGQETWERVLASGRQDALGFCTASDGTWSLATLRDKKSMEVAVHDHSEVWRSLGVSILHRLALDQCLAEGAAGGRMECTYVHLVSEVLDAVAKKNCELACLVQPATVDHIRRLAGTFEKMPPKSTYFYPKLASGLLFHPIQ